MKLQVFTIIKLTFSLILGIITARYADASLSFWAVAAAASFGLMFACWFRAKKLFLQDGWFGISVFLTVFFIGSLNFELHQPKNHQNHYTTVLNAGEDTFLQLNIREILRTDTYNEKYVAEIIASGKNRVSGNIVLAVAKDSTNATLNVDDIIVVKTALQDIPKPKNPHQFDYAKYMELQGVYHQTRITNERILHKEKGKTTLTGFAHGIRTHINEKLRQYEFSKDHIAMTNALLLGQKHDISPEMYQDYAAAGVVHILAVSGLHVGILMLLLQFILSPFDRVRNGKSIKMVVILLFLWCFAVIAGLSPSILRAVTMFSFLCVGMQLNRRTNTYNSLMASAFVLLLFNPGILFSIGFQLSYLAVWGILAFNPLLAKLYKPRNYVSRQVWGNITVSLSAQTGVLPLTFFYFHQFPGLFLFANLVILPFLGIILGTGILVIALASFSLLPHFLVVIYGFIIDSLNSFVNWVAQQDGFLFENISFSFLQMLAVYILTIACIFAWRKFSYKNVVFALVSIVLLQGVSIFHKAEAGRQQQMAVFHKSKNTVIGFKNGRSMTFYSALDSTEIMKQNFISSYLTHGRVKSVQTDAEAPFIFSFNRQTVLVVDSLSVYPEGFSPDIVLLTGSPKIHLDKLIASLQPKLIIADGNNYISYVERWKETSGKRNVSFHHTASEGAFVMNFR